MRTTDINCFVGYPPDMYQTMSAEVTPARLCAKLDKYSITDCVAFSSHGIIDIIKGNEEIVKIAEENSRIHPCYMVSPFPMSMNFETVGQIEKYLSDGKPEAVTMLPAMQKIKLDDFFCDGLLSVLNNFSMPLLLVMTWPPFYDLVAPLAQKYPNVKFVLQRADHESGGCIYEMLDKLNNVFFDISAMAGEGMLDKAVQRFGSKRFVFGSGASVFDPSGPLGLVHYGSFSEADKSNILSGSWQDLVDGRRF